MARPSELPLNVNRTPDTPQSNVQLPVAAPLIVQQGRTAADNLRDAIGAFGSIGKNLLDVKEKQWGVRGAEDAASGQGNATLFKWSPAYQQNFLRTTTQARFNLFSSSLRDEVSDLVEKNPLTTPQDVNELINQRFRDFTYGPNGQPQVGMDEASVAKDMVPVMAQVRQALVGNAAQAIKAKQDQNLIGAWSINVNAELQNTGTVDWNKQMQALTQGVGGTQANQALVQTIDALQAQDPTKDLVASLPDTWSDGTPTVKHIPKYADMLADIQQRSLRNAVWLRDQVRQQSGQQFQNTAVTAIVAGHSALPFAQAYMQTPGADAQMVQTVLSFQNSFQNNQSNGITDRNTYADLRLHSLTNPDDASLPVQAMQAFNSGYLNKADFSSLLSDISVNRQRAKDNPTFGTEEYRRFQQMLSNAYAPGMMDVTGDLKMQQGVAQAHFAALVASGKSLQDAFTQTQKDVPVVNPLVEQNGIISSYGFHVDSDAADTVRSGQQAAVRSALGNYKSGKMTAQAFASQLGPVAQNPQMLDRLGLSPAEKNEVLKALKASLGGSN